MSPAPAHGNPPPAPEISVAETTATHTAPGVRDARMAIELLVDGLAGVDVDLDHTGFYNRLAEVVARIGGMKRTIIFLFDEVTRRVQVAGTHGIDLESFSGFPISLDRAPDAARALVEDRVIEVRPPEIHRIPPEFTDLVGDHPLVYVPIAAAGRWPGVMIVEPDNAAAPLDDERRELLWTVGKTLALASVARIATYNGERARELEERIDLARDIHDGVVQRLFGVSMALTPSGALDDTARERCAEEVALALEDLRAAMQRPLGRPSRATGTTLALELQRLIRTRTDLDLSVDGEIPAVTPTLEPLVQSVLAEAMRNVQKHAQANSILVRSYRKDDVFVLEIENDGVAGRPHDRRPGMGLKLAALEALHAGGLLEFGQRAGGRWQVRLAVPERQP